MSNKNVNKSKELPPHKRKQCEPTRDKRPKYIRICSEPLPETKTKANSSTNSKTHDLYKFFGLKKDKISKTESDECPRVEPREPSNTLPSMKMPEFNLTDIKSNISVYLQSSKLNLGRRQKQVIMKWVPSAGIYCAASAIAVIYFCDWETVLKYLPFYNTKYTEGNASGDQ